MARLLVGLLASFFAVLAAGAAADDGCWVHAFERTQFRPPVTTYTGPSHEPLFIKQAESLIVGPRARLVGYAAGRYAEQTVALGAGTRLPDLAAIGFHKRMDSFQLLCTDG